jgi:hypothetical protein
MMLGFGTSHVNNPCSSCLLPSFAFLWGHSWNPFERTLVVVVLYTFTAFVQREVRWAIILRYTKRFEIYLIFFQTGSGLHAQWTRCVSMTRCTRGTHTHMCIRHGVHTSTVLIIPPPPLTQAN